jgi:hypothetical protein
MCAHRCRCSADTAQKGAFMREERRVDKDGCGVKVKLIYWNWDGTILPNVV